MKTIDIFYQGEGLRKIEHLVIEADVTFAIVKAKLSERHGFGVDALLFAEDEDAPLEDTARVFDNDCATGLRLHLNRCRRIKVYVTFNGVTVDREFAPGATVARVKRWITERGFQMSKADAGEHLLQISGTHDRPDPNIHVGTLSPPKTCTVHFDLIPDERVNGALESDA